MNILFHTLTELQIFNKKFKLIYLSKAGSLLYGLHTPNSDEDYIGIFIASDDYYLGLNTVKELNFSIKEKNIEIKLYELKNFVKLAMQNNPNIIELLFVNPYHHLLYLSEEGKLLLDHKNLFPTKEAYNRFMGYAISQKHKMVIKKENYGELQSFIDLLRNYNIQFDNKTILNDLKYNKYFEAFKNNFKGNNFKIGDMQFPISRKVKKVYEDIKERLDKASRYEKYVLKYGYDTKFASHLIRLLSEGKELLETGKITFPLKERDLIFNIKIGEVKLEEVLRIAEKYETEMKNIRNKTPLPVKSQFNKINELLKEILVYSLFPTPLLIYKKGGNDVS